LKDIPETIPARAKTKVAELKRHLNALEKSAAAPASAQDTKGTAKSKSNWSKEVADIDKILTELVGPPSASGASATGTTGATGAEPKSGSSASMTLDETTKSKLMEVRTHVTAFAAAMSGTGGAAASAPSPEPSATEPSAAAATQPTTSEPGAATAPQSSTPTSYASQSAPGQQPATQNPTGAEQAQQPTASANPQVDPNAPKQHLTAARESLSQLTQLPAAAQLTGEARTQVSQLISNFNELITTKENWRASYDKVGANLNALLGAETATQTPQPAQAAEAGAVGTSGKSTESIDPAIRAKLVEFRMHLSKFEEAAGGAESPASSQGASASMAAQSQSAQAGTTGQQSASPSATGQDAVRHIEAIEAILSGASPSSSPSTGAPAGNAPAGTTGASTTTGSVTLNQSQVEQIRMHLSELRKAVNK
jgi:hypothetical protein